MKIISTALLLSVLLPTFCLAGHTATDFDIQWIQDQHVIGVNREAGHATLILYSSKAALLADEYHKRPWVTPTKAMTLDLNGKWRFRYVPGSNQGPGASEFQAEDYNDERWPLITVPMNWEMAGYSKPTYNNTSYPFKNDPPRAMDGYEEHGVVGNNATGFYRRTYRLELLNAEGKVIAQQEQKVKFTEGNINLNLTTGLLKDLHAWNTEEPYLYDVIVSQLDGKQEEMVFCTKYGFRNIQLVNTETDKYVTVNGKRIFFKGTNIHDAHPLYGRYVDVPTMLSDVTLMKQANINTVRTSHYPCQPKMYAMFDAYGQTFAHFDLWQRGIGNNSCFSDSCLPKYETPYPGNNQGSSLTYTLRFIPEIN